MQPEEVQVEGARNVPVPRLWRSGQFVTHAVHFVTSAAWRIWILNFRYCRVWMRR